MHWSVGMLLHAVCVFFFKGEKKKLVEKLTGGCFPTHFLASMVLLIWITFHLSHLLISLFNFLCFEYHPCFDLKQVTGYKLLFVLVWPRN